MFNFLFLSIILLTKSVVFWILFFFSIDLLYSCLKSFIELFFSYSLLIYWIKTILFIGNRKLILFDNAFRISDAEFDFFFSTFEKWNFVFIIFLIFWIFFFSSFNSSNIFLLFLFCYFLLMCLNYLILNIQKNYFFLFLVILFYFR